MEGYAGVELLGAFVAVVVAAAMWLRKMKPQFAADDKLAAIATADTGIAERLMKEADRLSGQNDILAAQLNTMQLELIKLSTENSKLHMEIIGLREENAELRKEMAQMTEMLAQMQRRPPECEQCSHNLKGRK